MRNMFLSLLAFVSFSATADVLMKCVARAEDTPEAISIEAGYEVVNGHYVSSGDVDLRVRNAKGEFLTGASGRDTAGWHAIASSNDSRFQYDVRDEAGNFVQIDHREGAETGDRIEVVLLPTATLEGYSRTFTNGTCRFVEN